MEATLPVFSNSVVAVTNEDPSSKQKRYMLDWVRRIAVLEVCAHIRENIYAARI